MSDEDKKKYDKQDAAEETGVSVKEASGAWHNARNAAATDPDPSWRPGNRGVKKEATKK